MRHEREVLPAAVSILGRVLGGGSLLLFAAFLLFGPPCPVRLAGSDTSRLLVDALLCLVFFAQHSAMVRPAAKARMARWMPAAYIPAAYSIASALTLTALILLWQPVGRILYDLTGPAHWFARAAAVAALAGFAIGVGALHAFDPFGADSLAAWVKGARPPGSTFVVRGPYRYLRHPLYLFTLVLVWSAPRVTTDRLLFNGLTTAWILLGAWLEERDLVREFGSTYARYQREVPMLVPRPRRRPRR